MTFRCGLLVLVKEWGAHCISRHHGSGGTSSYDSEGDSALLNRRSRKGVLLGEIQDREELEKTTQHSPAKAPRAELRRKTRPTAGDTELWSGPSWTHCLQL